MISESDAAKYFHVKVNGLKEDEAVYFPERMTAISKTKRRIS